MATEINSDIKRESNVTRRAIFFPLSSSSSLRQRRPKPRDFLQNEVTKTTELDFSDVRIKPRCIKSAALVPFC
jgi:hypothetical protein